MLRYAIAYQPTGFCTWIMTTRGALTTMWPTMTTPQNKYGARILYGTGAIKTRLVLERWTRDYPNAYAFDVATRGEKTYNGSNLKFKADWEKSANSSLWAEVIVNIQNSTDLRYDYDRNQIMAGMSWTY